MTEPRTFLVRSGSGFRRKCRDCKRPIFIAQMSLSRHWLVFDPDVRLTLVQLESGDYAQEIHGVPHVLTCPKARTSTSQARRVDGAA